MAHVCRQYDFRTPQLQLRRQPGKPTCKVHGQESNREHLSLAELDELETAKLASASPPACSLSDMESTSLMKQEATASLLITQLVSCSLV